MYKKLMLLLVAGLLMIHVIGCGNKNNQESTEMDESAVDSSADDIEITQVDSANLPNLSSDIQDDEPVIEEEADLSCILPEGFVAYEGEEGLYVHKSYPKEIATISYIISENDEDIMELSLDEYKAMLEEDFMESYGDRVQVLITQYDNIRVDGRKGLKIKLQYEFKGIVYEQLIYNLKNGSETHSLNYTQELDDGWMEAFEKSGETITFIARN